MTDFEVLQTAPMMMPRHPNTWKLTNAAGASPQNAQVVATGVAAKHVFVGYLLLSNSGDATVTVKIAWESGTNFMQVDVPSGGVTLQNFVGIEPYSATADKDLLADVTSDDTIALAITCGYFEVPA